FSSRRRHTRWPRDWSSDVCSSDLVRVDDVDVETRAMCHLPAYAAGCRPLIRKPVVVGDERQLSKPTPRGGEVFGNAPAVEHAARSEERRVGKQGGCPG